MTCTKWVLGPEARVQDRPFEEQPSTWGTGSQDAQ